MSVEQGPEPGDLRAAQISEGEPMGLFTLVTHKDLFGPEAEPRPVEALVMVCEDDDIVAGPGTGLVGLVASGETRLGAGNQEVYPDDDRQAMSRVAPVITEAMNSIATDLGVGYGETSHPGCGGGNAQEIPAEELPQATQRSVEDRGGTFWGHLEVSHEPQLLDADDAEVQASITRPEEDHHHGAEYVFITVGGAISGEEKEALVNEYGPGFQVSADFLNRAVEANASQDDLRAIILRQIEIAKAIAPGVKENGSRLVVYNAGRLQDEETQSNLDLISEFLR